MKKMILLGCALLTTCSLVLCGAKRESKKPISEEAAELNREFLSAITGDYLSSNLTQAAKLLARGADINARNSDGKTALMIASPYGKIDAVKFLLDHGADVNIQNRGKTALGWLPMYMFNREAIVKLFRDAGGVETTYSKEETDLLNKKLFAAVKSNNIARMKELTQEGAQLDAQDSAGRTPLMYAVQKRLWEMITSLILEGVFDFTIDLDIKDNKGKTALDYADNLKKIDVMPGSFEIITISTPGRESFADLTEKNQREYADRYGYGYKKFKKSFDSSRPEEWSKIAALFENMETPLGSPNKISHSHRETGREKTSKKYPEWLLWIDDDIVITKNYSNNIAIPEKKLEAFVAEHPGKELIIAQDALKPINNGIFLIKNTPWSRKFLMDVWLTGAKRAGYGLLKRGASLLEQEAMTDLIEQNPEYKDKTVILEQRAMNSFIRSPKQYPNDPDQSKWQPGDFAAHVAGMPREERVRIITELIADSSKKPIVE